MRRFSRVVLVGGVLAAAGLAPAPARAQIDVNPPLPNVMLLLDTSGSMEKMFDGTNPEDNAGTDCRNVNNPQPLNRWATLVSVLTGTINNFTCDAFDRKGGPFKALYTWGLPSAAPYDANYYLPFHRLFSNGCTPAPGTAPTLDYWDWPANAIVYQDATGNAGQCAGANGWSQANDGVLDIFRTRVRFGMMTFDNFPDPSTGAALTLPDAQGGVKGMWSYFLNWQLGGAGAQGNPPNCVGSSFEVGARSPAAPPWEGRMIPFGAFDSTLLDVETNNDHIQQAITAMRPYGSTPIAGMLSDARDFFFKDTSKDPANPTKDFGPKADPYFSCGRQNYAILVTDGQPNMDLRPACNTKVGNVTGTCPYDLPENIAHDMNINPPTAGEGVTTYVIALALSNVNGFDCKTLTVPDLTQPGGKCDGATGGLATCCNLGRIANLGGSIKPYFADNINDLKIALSTVLGNISKGSTSRTLPVFSSTAASVQAEGNALAVGYQFLSSFNVNVGGGSWSGNLQRARYQCVNNVASLQDIQLNLGDDFGNNLNGNQPSRQFMTVIGAKTNGLINSQQTIRATTVTGDGIGTYVGAATNAGVPIDGATFATTVANAPEAFGIPPLAPPAACTATLLAPNNAASCVTRLVKWEVGLSNQPTLPDVRAPTALCPTCSALGAIYHSTPSISGPPREYLRDEAYSAFANTQSLRPTMLYTGTTDGQLHAFKVAANDPNDGVKVDSPANNELWSFLPPFVLPGLLPNYNAEAFLLDGAVVTKDVVLDRVAGVVPQWSTVLVGSGGQGGGFYYALDVTNPKAPKYLWQLATDGNNNRLFGQVTPAPAVATLAVNIKGTVHEVAVAILAGGSSASPGGACNRRGGSTVMKVGGTFTQRTAVRCWGAPGAPYASPSRTVTIARIDTGEILAVFANAADAAVLTYIAQNTNYIQPPPAPFDSPLSGVPVAYPSATGQVADRVYVGDSDGTIWRLDLSGQIPSQWTASLAWDGYSMAGDGALDGQPIQTTPIVSTDPVGNTVILFSTGDQEVLSASAIKTRAWSLLETPNGGNNGPSIDANWALPLSTGVNGGPFPNGTRVTGPMSLFNSVVYFGTFAPTSNVGAACQTGYGSIWALDYIHPVLGSSPPYPKTGWAQGGPPNQDQPAGTVVFGVSVTQTPTCSNSTVINDPYFGNRTTFSAVNPGSFQLVIQTGKAGAPPVANAKTNTTNVLLPAPRQSTRIDSWASIVE